MEERKMSTFEDGLSLAAEDVIPFLDVSETDPKKRNKKIRLDRLQSQLAVTPKPFERLKIQLQIADQNTIDLSSVEKADIIEIRSTPRDRTIEALTGGLEGKRYELRFVHCAATFQPTEQIILAGRQELVLASGGVDFVEFERQGTIYVQKNGETYGEIVVEPLASTDELAEGQHPTRRYFTPEREKALVKTADKASRTDISKGRSGKWVAALELQQLLGDVEASPLWSAIGTVAEQLSDLYLRSYAMLAREVETSLSQTAVLVEYGWDKDDPDLMRDYHQGFLVLEEGTTALRIIGGLNTAATSRLVLHVKKRTAQAIPIQLYTRQFPSENLVQDTQFYANTSSLVGADDSYFQIQVWGVSSPDPGVNKSMIVTPLTILNY